MARRQRRERVSHLARRGEAPVRVTCQSAQEEAVDVGREIGRRPARQRDGAGADLDDDVDGGRALERGDASDGAEEDGPQRPEVGAVVDAARAARLLGAHVLRRAHEHVAARDVESLGLLGPAQRLGDAEIEDLDDLLVVHARQEDIGGLEVTVDDARAVRASQGLAHLRADDPGLPQREAPLAFEAVAEVLAEQQLHHDVGEVLVDAMVEHLDHVGAPEPRRGSRLPRESSAGVRQLGERRAHEFDGNELVQLEVTRDPHGAHAAAGELPLQPILARDHRSFAERNQAAPPGDRESLHPTPTSSTQATSHRIELLHARASTDEGAGDARRTIHPSHCLPERRGNRTDVPAAVVLTSRGGYGRMSQCEASVLPAGS